MNNGAHLVYQSHVELTLSLRVNELVQRILVLSPRVNDACLHKGLARAIIARPRLPFAIIAGTFHHDVSHHTVACTATGAAATLRRAGTFRPLLLQRPLSLSAYQ